MNFLNLFTEAFSQFQVDLKSRPDGTLLLVLTDETGHPLRKAISGRALHDEDCARGIIRELQREMKLASGEAIWHARGIDWVSRELPTYYGGGLHMTAAKTLVARRKLEHSRHIATN
ncbi:MULTISPECIES: DUF3509 domain-containing protein [unclassified Pseudomonas]|jgi:hypothetical protein|uniref:DUF3509 domain-containing protein n=1 Tax=unclassified Pseudomonas TaxID=196821 RepID=UPI000EA8C5E2|nr:MULTISPECIES: DUF3509 domain-containing protein [unclassified Pseudomonas]AYF86755.1 DUF3509 domain-containing protein [Pseudomonas sp. DY-1]MRK21995.1 DUF3509 domain-containing protein [Pseudomonas sp. JG-B]